MKTYGIREVRISDAERLAEIYSYYVRNTAVSFEYKAPSAVEFEERIKKVNEKKYPYLACTENGRIVGYVFMIH